MKVLIWGPPKLPMCFSLSMHGWGVPGTGSSLCWLWPLTSILLWNLPKHRKIRGRWEEEGGKMLLTPGLVCYNEIGGRQWEAQGSRVSRWKRSIRKEQLDSCSGIPLGMEVSLSVLRGRLMEKMTKRVPRWTGVKGRRLQRRHPCRSYVGSYAQWGSQAGEGNIPRREELVPHSRILFYPLFLFSRLFCWYIVL